MQKIKLMTSEGAKEFWFIPDGAEYEAARVDGEIHIGDEIVYRNYLVIIIEDYEMLILERLQGMPFGQNGSWSFTVSPEQMAEFMRGGQL